MSEYLVQAKKSEVEGEIVSGAESRRILQEKGGIDFNVLKSNRFYNTGEIVGFQFITNDGEVFEKKANGTTLIDTLCEYAGCKLIRVSENGTQDSKCLGYIVEEEDTSSSSKTTNEMEESEMDEEQTVEFKILWNQNKEVYIEGYVEIPADECEEDEIDWYFYDAQNVPRRQQIYTEHEGIDRFKGATEEQEWEIEQFLADYHNDELWIDTAICQSNADENKTYVREKCTLIINEGE